MKSTFWALLALPVVHSLQSFISESSYITDWIQLNYTVEGNWPANTAVAQQEIVSAAQQLAAAGPWSVMNKTIAAPSGDRHDYLSWSPYWWPDCSNVHNTTALTPEQIWVQCNYQVRDGQFNPDRSLVNDTGNFAVMSDAIWFNVLAYKITNDATYAQNAANFINVWFLNPDTSMNPNLEYSQIIRGANGSHNGTHEGILDLHCITKIVSGIFVLQALNSTAWTPDMNTAMVAWSQKYLAWLTSNTLALQEKAATNNHGSFYFSHTAAVQIMTGDHAGATTLLHEYFDGIYKAQIVKGGEQPFEAARTRPYHYRAYNAGAIITIHRMAEYLGWNSWDTPTTAGATIKDAVDFAMTVPADDEGPSELYPDVAAVAAHYGDPDGKYAAWLAQKEPLYPGEAWFFWNQPLSNSGVAVHVDATGSLVAGNATASTNGSTTTGGGSSTGNNKSASVASYISPTITNAVAVVFTAMFGLLL